jgi:hypothetical protein
MQVYEMRVQVSSQDGRKCHPLGDSRLSNRHRNLYFNGKCLGRFIGRGRAIRSPRASTLGASFSCSYQTLQVGVAQAATATPMSSRTRLAANIRTPTSSVQRVRPNPSLKRSANGRPPGPGRWVLRTFSPARPWRPAVGSRLARTLGRTRRPRVTSLAWWRATTHHRRQVSFTKSRSDVSNVNRRSQEDDRYYIL